MRKFLSMIADCLSIISAFSVLLMMFHILIDVLGKYFFKMPVPSTAEIVANYYMISTVFFSLAYIEIKKSHIAVDLLYDRVSSSIKNVFNTLAIFMTVLFYLGLGWFSYESATRSFDMNETIDGIWRVTVWPAKFMLPIGLIVAAFIAISNIINKSEA